MSSRWKSEREADGRPNEIRCYITNLSAGEKDTYEESSDLDDSKHASAVPNLPRASL